MICVPPSRKLTLLVLHPGRLEEVERLLDRRRLLRDLVGQPVEAGDAVVLRHRVLVAGVVVGLRERRREVRQVRDQLARERHDQPEVRHRLHRVAGRRDHVVLRAARPQLGEDLVVRAEAGDLDVRAVLLRVALVVRRIGVVDPVRQQQVAVLDLPVGRRRRLLGRGLLVPAAPARAAGLAAAAGRSAAAGGVGGHRRGAAGVQRLAARDHALHRGDLLVRDQDVELVGSVGHLRRFLSGIRPAFRVAPQDGTRPSRPPRGRAAALPSGSIRATPCRRG